jgi:1-acyl-sn-glycerol-3-phosphate acyltransferase
MYHEAEASESSSFSTPGLRNRAWGVAATVLSVLYTLILTTLCVPLAVVANGHGVTPLMRLWSWLIFHTCGISAEIEGLENLEGAGSVVLVSNHQSLLDIVAVTKLIPREIRFVAKRELTKVPLVGFVMARSGNVVIDRTSGGKEIRRALDAIGHGYSICVFAEGHRFSDNRVHAFSEGAAWLAIATGLPCVPLAISGTAALMPRGAKFVVPGRKMRMVLGKPLETKGLKGSDRAELTRRLVAEVRASYRSEI